MHRSAYDQGAERVFGLLGADISATLKPEVEQTAAGQSLEYW